METETNSELIEWINLSTQRTMEEFLRFIHARGLTMPQMNVLMMLHYSGPSEITALTQRLQVGKSAVSQMVERLVQMGYLDRTSDEQDHRTRWVQITPAAQALVTEGIAFRQAWITELYSDLSQDEQAAICQALKILNARLGAGVPTPLA